MNGRKAIVDTIGTQTRLVVLEDGEPVEFAVSYAGGRQDRLGNLYKARVQTLLSKFLLFHSVDRIVLYVNPAYGVREQPCAIKAEAFSKTVVDFYNLGGVGAPSLAMTITA